MSWNWFYKLQLLLLFLKNVLSFVHFTESDWYLCHVVIVAVEEEPISWEMYPYPYLARVDPGARAGTSVYQLVARYCHSENTSVGISYALIAGKHVLHLFDGSKSWGLPA